VDAETARTSIVVTFLLRRVVPCLGFGIPMPPRDTRSHTAARGARSTAAHGRRKAVKDVW